MKLIWTPRAQLRIRSIHDRIAEDSPRNARDWVARVLAHADQIGTQPRSGRKVPEFQRETIREVFEGDYRIIYRIRSRQVDVLTVRHGARKMPESTAGL